MKCLLWILVLTLCGAVLGEVHFVAPGMSVQDVVNASASGDTVILEHGVHVATAVLGGRDLTIASRYLLDGDSNHVFQTIVRADTTNPDTASCFVYVCGESPASRLVGLVMESGRGTRDDFANVAHGGAVYVRGATGTAGVSIERCHFQFCRAIVGAAIFARPYSGFANVRLTDCHFYGCHAAGIGGAVAVESCSLQVERCVFEACSAYTEYGGGFGSTLYAIASPIFVRDCQFLSCVNGVSAALWILNMYWRGTITGCVFDDNRLLFSEGLVADLQMELSTFTVSGCRFMRNTSGYGSIVLTGQMPYTFVGNTVENNVSSIVNGTVGLSGRYGDVAYNIFRGNTNPHGAPIVSYAGTPPIQARIHHNLISGNVSMDSTRPSGFLAAGMVPGLDSNWFFGNRGLAVGHHPSMPALIDARHNYWGHPSGPYHPTQNPQGQGDTLLSDSVLFIPWLTEPPDTSLPEGYLAVSPERTPLPSTWHLLDCYPNPFNQSVTLVMAGFASGDFEIELYNLLGQVVDVVHRGPLTGGQIHYQAPAYLSSGVYLLSAHDKQNVQTKKVVLLK